MLTKVGFAAHAAALQAPETSKAGISLSKGLARFLHSAVNLAVSSSVTAPF